MAEFAPNLGLTLGWKGLDLPSEPQSLLSITPAFSWDGTQGSGFTATPSDPARSTAKPILRPLTPPRQRFDDKLTVGVWAAANEGGTLIDNMGLEKVICHYEGNSVDITEPTLHTFPDANGVSRTYVGWWIDLEYSGDGKANVYFEAVPSDATMQHRVIGPYQYHPNAVEWDYELEVAPSLPSIVGQRYQDIDGAWSYLRTEDALGQCKITVTEPTTDILGRPGFGFNRGPDAGWIVITATAPVTITAPRDGNNLPTALRPQCEPVCFRGDNLTIDFANFTEYYFEPGYSIDNWMDGINLIRSTGRRDLSVALEPRTGTSQLLRGSHWITECYASDLSNTFQGEHLVRGCEMVDCWNNAFSGTKLVIGTTLENFGDSWMREGVPAATVHYTGAGAAATLESSGIAFNDRTWTAKVDGSTFGTFTLESATSDYLADTAYRVQHFVDWVNSLTDFTATLLDDTRAGHSLGLNTGVPGVGFSAVDVKNAVTTFYTRFDIHPDIFPKDNGSLFENAALVNTRGWGLFSQDVFLSGTPGCSDVAVINCGFDNLPGDGQFSQFARKHSHVIFAHNSMSTQGMLLRVDLGYDPDSYCLMANNALPGLSWSGGDDATLDLANNHFQAGASVPNHATGTTTGGDENSLHIDAPGGDFTPAGDLLSNLKPPVFKWNLENNIRGGAAAAGS